jgi:hypothetical protein
MPCHLHHPCPPPTAAASAVVAAAQSAAAANSATAAARWQQRGGCGSGGSATARHRRQHGDLRSGKKINDSDRLSQFNKRCHRRRRRRRRWRRRGIGDRGGRRHECRHCCRHNDAVGTVVSPSSTKEKNAYVSKSVAFKGACVSAFADGAGESATASVLMPPRCRRCAVRRRRASRCCHRR